MGLSLSANGQPTLLVVGDSLSSAYGIPPDLGWVTLMQERLSKQMPHFQVINISNPGDTTSNGLEKLPKALDQYQPSIVIIALGSNDGLRGLPANEMRKNLDILITLSKKHHAKVLLVGFLIPVNYGPVYRKQFEAVFQSLIRQHHLVNVPFLLKNVALDPHLMQSDGLHPNESAQPIILQNVWPYLKKLF